MKILVTESQLEYILEQQQSEDLCLRDFVETVNSHLDGIVELTPEEIYSAYENSTELLSQISDPKVKDLVNKIYTNISQMDFEQLKSELKNVLSLVKTLKEQQTPYLDQTMSIGGTQVPKVLVHTVGGLAIISLLSTIINGLGERMDSVKPRRRSGSKYIVGCQGARSRAKAVRRRRRRENWRSFLRKIGLR